MVRRISSLSLADYKLQATLSDAARGHDNGLMRTPDASTGALDHALARIGDRWSLLVVEALLAGAQRFTELEAAVPGIATNVLAQRLKQLERDAIIVAVPYSNRPLRFSYELTLRGRDLAGALRLLAQWGASHDGLADEPLSHRTCGTALEVRWYCPTCERTVSDEEAADDDRFV